VHKTPFRAEKGRFLQYICKYPLCVCCIP